MRTDHILNKMLGKAKKNNNNFNTNIQKPKPIKTTTIADKPVHIFNNHPIPTKQQINKVYKKIPDDTSIPLQFMTREQYVKKYVANQEIKNGSPFNEEQKKEFLNYKKDKYSNIIGRYTTKQNPYYKPAVVVFNDPVNQKNIQGKKFEELAWHEYGHELAEREKIKLNHNEEEYFADRIAKKGMNKNPFSDTTAKNKILQEIRSKKKDNINVDNYSQNNIERTKKGYMKLICEDCGKEMSINTFQNHWKNCPAKYIEKDEYSENLTQSLWHAGDKPPSETLKEQGRVYGFSSKEYADGWREKEGKQNIYQFTADEYDLDNKTYIRDTPQGKKYSDNEYIVKNVLGERIHEDVESKDKITHRNEEFPAYNEPKKYKGLQDYKFRVLAKDNGEVRIVNFGHKDYEDYTIHKDKKRRDNFRARHKCDPVNKLDKLKPRYWACEYLWEKD